jgi:hypothetical protein
MLSTLVRVRFRSVLIGLATTAALWGHSPAPRPHEIPHPPFPSKALNSRSDAAAMQLLRVAEPGAHVLVAISRDLDRDGDLDVVGSTAEAPLVIWINEGDGHFTRQRPTSGPMVSSHPDGVERGSDRPLQTGVTPRSPDDLLPALTVVPVPGGADPLWLGSSPPTQQAWLAHRPARGPPASFLIA